MQQEKIYYFANPEERRLFNELRKKVDNRISTLPDRHIYMQIKAFALPALYFGSYFFALYHTSNPWVYVGLFVLMGISLVLIYLNLLHEAAHNNVFKTRFLNTMVLRIFDLIGANSYIWKRRHIISHHAFPNVDGYDTDVEQSGPIKIFPHGEAKGMQRYQDKFVFFLYPFYLFNWMLLRDFKDYFSTDRVIYKMGGPVPKSQLFRMILYKLFYFFYQIAVPVLFFKVSFGLAFGAWFAQVMVASIFALFVLLPLHPLPDNAFPVPDKDHILPYGWMRHQLEVTNDLKENNWFIRHLLGNFNFHVAHHMFPKYSYPYYSEITEEIVAFAKAHHLPYKRFPLFTALGKHYQLLKMNAHNEPLHHVFEELDS